MDIGLFALNVVTSLVAQAIWAAGGAWQEHALNKRRVERKIEDVVQSVVEPLIAFLTSEGVTPERQQLLLQTCIGELTPLAADPTELLTGSLNGQKIFDELYKDRGLPQAILDEDLSAFYGLAFPRIATLLCRVPPAILDWEAHAWAETFRRFDELSMELRTLFAKVDAFSATSASSDATTMTLVRQTLLQRLGIEMDLTGLRGDEPVPAKFEDMFVHPGLLTTRHKESLRLGSGSQSLAEFSQAGVRAVVQGSAGSGKSTWSRWLQRECLGEEWGGLPVRIECRALDVQALPKLQDAVRHTVGKHLEEEATAERIRHWLDEGAVIFIMDGFDELNRDARSPVMDWICELATAASRCPIVVTSRPLTTDHIEHLPPAWERWELEPFDQARVLDYIKRWYAHTPLLLDGRDGVRAEALAISWSADPTISPLTGNPLLLSTLLMVHHLDGSLPEGRALLYRRYVDGMLGLWDNRRQVKATDVNSALKRYVLTYLAVRFQIGDVDQVDEEEALAIVTQALSAKGRADEAPTVLSVLRERTGLVVGPGVYSFVHKSVGEYLVAEAVVQGNYRTRRGQRLDRWSLLEKRTDDRWNVVTILWAGLASIAEVEEFIDACLDNSDIGLGYALLLDQYPRFDGDTVRRLIRRLKERRNARQLRRDYHYYFTTCPFAGDKELAIPDVGLRSLQGHATLASVVGKVAADGLIGPSDVSQATGPLRDLLWMALIANTDSIGVWGACSGQAMPSSGDCDVWLYWLAETVVRRICDERIEASTASTWLAEYRGAHTKSEHYLPLAMIGLLGAALLGDALNTRPPDNLPMLQQFAKVLPEIQKIAIPHVALGPTASWRRRWQRVGEKRDLLAVTQSALNDAVVANAELRDSLQYIERLIATRGGL